MNRHAITNERSEKGFMLVFVVGVIVVVIGIILMVILMNKPKQSNGILNIDKGTSNSKRLEENAKRKNDASTLSAAVHEFMNNNSGKRPTGWKDGKLVGDVGSMTPTAVDGLTFYTSVEVAEGEQPPLQADALRFVSKAICSAEAGTILNTRSVTGFAVQYGEIRQSGAFVPRCL